MFSRLFLIIIVMAISCSPIAYNKYLYQAEIEILRKDKTVDTMTVVYWDYLTVYDSKIFKKDSTIVATNVKKYKFVERKLVIIK
jgi:hypothetical protein